jgi:hypothetical protein
VSSCEPGRLHYYLIVTIFYENLAPPRPASTGPAAESQAASEPGPPHAARPRTHDKYKHYYHMFPAKQLTYKVDHSLRPGGWGGTGVKNLLLPMPRA